MTEFTMVAGDNRPLVLSVTNDDGTPVNLTGSTVAWFAGKVPYTAPILTKPGNLSGTPTDGTFTVDLVPLDTTGLGGTFYHWATVTNGGALSTIFFGAFTIMPSSALVTVEDFKTRFPEFAPVSDALVSMVLDEASTRIGTTWLEADRVPAIRYLAAHMLTLQGEPGRSISTATGAGSIDVVGPMKRRRVGDVEVEFAGKSSSSGSSGGVTTGPIDAMLLSTNYGKMYVGIRNRNFSGPVVA